MPQLKALLGPMRLPFLTLTPVCVAVGVGTAYWQQRMVNALDVLLVLAGALCAHISVNAFNEYFDWKSGLDAKTERTPFSGGSGTLQAKPELARSTFILAWLTFGFTAAVGLYFLWQRGLGLLPIGVLGLVLVYTYTTFWVYHPVLCLLAPGLGFGILMVMGTHFALTGTYSSSALVASLVPSFLVSNLLLLNQFPDVEADRSIGRKHFPAMIGRKPSTALFGVLLVLSYLTLVFGVVFKVLPPLTLLALFSFPLALRTYQGASRYADDIPALVPYMGMNVIICLATPALLALGFFIG